MVDSAYDSFFPWAFLARHAYEPAVLPSAGQQPLRRCVASVSILGWRLAGASSANQTNSAELHRNMTLWDKGIAETIPSVTYENVLESEAGVWEWVKRIVRLLLLGPHLVVRTGADAHVLDCAQEELGFCFVKGVPPTPEATEQLVRRIAFIRETHYGGFWDFTADLAHGDLAYSDVLLRAHTDTTYFTDVSERTR